MEFKINIILLINNKINIGQEYLYWHMLLYTKLKFPYFPITFLIFLSLDSEPSIKLLLKVTLPELETFWLLRHHWIITDQLFTVAWLHNG